MQLDEKISPIFDLIFFTFLRQYQGGAGKKQAWTVPFLILNNPGVCGARRHHAIKALSRVGRWRNTVLQRPPGRGRGRILNM